MAGSGVIGFTASFYKPKFLDELWLNKYISLVVSTFYIFKDPSMPRDGKLLFSKKSTASYCDDFKLLDVVPPL